MFRFFCFACVFALSITSAWAQERYFDLSLCSSDAATDLLEIQATGAKVTKPAQLGFNSARVIVEGYRFSDEHNIDMRLTFYKGRLMEIYIPIFDPHWHRRLFMGGFAYFLSNALVHKYRGATAVGYHNKGGVDVRQWLVADGAVLISHQLNQYANSGREDRDRVEYFTYTCQELVAARSEEMSQERRQQEIQRERRIRDAAGKI